MEFATRAIHSGQDADTATGATITPIYQTSTYTQESLGVNKGFEYSRTGNPTRAALETCLAALENARYGLAFGSGMAATAAVLSLLRPGDHVVAGDDLYGGTYRILEQVFRPSGIDVDYVPAREVDAYRAALRPETKLIWVETPTNPLLSLVDIAAVAQIARAKDVRLVVDNTFATPYLQRPLDLGAHLVVHSTTKYINGHSDVIGGAVLTSDEEAYAAIKFYQNAAGGVPSPFDSWLVLRGVKTLAVRMRQHCENAAARGGVSRPANPGEGGVLPRAAGLIPTTRWRRARCRDSGGDGLLCLRRHERRRRYLRAEPARVCPGGEPGRRRIPLLPSQQHDSRLDTAGGARAARRYRHLAASLRRHRRRRGPDCRSGAGAGSSHPGDQFDPVRRLC